MTAKVTVVNSRLVQCTILCVGPSVLARPYRGVLKKEDIKSTDKDRIDPYKCFRPGDIILARVVSFSKSLWILPLKNNAYSESKGCSVTISFNG